MPFYQYINPKTIEGKRTLNRLLKLKEALDEIPAKTVDETLLLATWNIRDFDKPAYGLRSDESIYYMAEIVSRFDLVAIQEVYKDLKGLKRLLKVLGGYWKYVVTDMTEGSQGNKERMAFLYDSRKVNFGGLAGELVLPSVKAKGGKTVPAQQVWRTPFLCGFRSGWSRFMLASVHILWGKGSGNSEPADRVAEIAKVADFLKKRTQDKTAWSRNLILVGDFNIFSYESEAFGKLLEAGFEIPEAHRVVNTNAKKDRPYDQIAFRIQKDRLGWTQQAGVFDFFKYVFTEGDEKLYAKAMGEPYEKIQSGKNKGKERTAKQRTAYYKTYWRTHQMSDHLPRWVELKIDFSKRYLERKKGGEV